MPKRTRWRVAFAKKRALVKRVCKKLSKLENLKKMGRNKKPRIIGGILLVALLIACSTVAVVAAESNVQTNLIGNAIQPVNAPLNFSLSQDLKVSGAKVTISPQAKVTAAFSGGGLGETHLTLTPTEPLLRNQQYKVQITDLKRLASGRAVATQTITFRTELAPGVASFTPQNTQITRDAVFTMVATDHVVAAKKIVLQFEPKIELIAKFDNNTTWQWRPKQPLPQGKTYRVTLLADGHVLQKTDYTVAGEPQITKATAKDYFYPDERITVGFSKPMRTDQKDVINFAMPGQGNWDDDKTYVFVPQKLEPNKSYDYTFKAGFVSKDGGVLEADKKYTIKTPGPARVVGISPSGAERSRKSQIRVNFDQPVDHASAQKHFQISPQPEGSLSWSGNALIFTPKDLGFQVAYTVTLTPGIVAKYGVPSVTTASTHFSTEVETKRLAVPAYHQTYKLSCEASALRMALAYHGVYADDMTITQRMGYTPRPLSNGVWDDPYSQFVGDLNGRQGDKTGYGVYAAPVAKAARSLGRNATSHSGVSAGFIAEQIHAGRPVVVWGYISNPSRFSWKTPSGKEIQAWQGEHTRTVVGVKGRADGPLGFYVTDPASGGTSYWSTSKLMGNMNVHGSLSNQAVVVY